MALQVSNNAICTLQNPVLEDSTVIFLAGNYDRFPTTNFVVEIATFNSNGTVTARENILVTSRSGNQLIVGQRACEPVPIDDDASTNIEQPLAFNIQGTVVKQVISKKLIEEIQKGISDINEDLVTDYINQNEKGAANGIPTLGADGKIPTTQIDGSKLDIPSLNKNFTAGENISKGDIVQIKEYNVVPISNSASFTIMDGNTHSISIDGGYITTLVVKGVFDDNTSVTMNWTISFNGTTYTQTSSSNSHTYTFVVNNTISQSNLDITFERYDSGNDYQGTVTFDLDVSVVTYKSYENKVEKATKGTNDYIGIAQESKNANEDIMICTQGVVSGLSGLSPVTDYFLSDTTDGGTQTSPNGRPIGTALSATEFYFNKGLGGQLISGSYSFTTTATSYTLSHSLRRAPNLIVGRTSGVGGTLREVGLGLRSANGAEPIFTENTSSQTRRVDITSVSNNTITFTTQGNTKTLSVYFLIY